MSIKTMSIQECRRLIEAGQPLNIIDVRTTPEFNKVHAVGARLMPLDELNPAAFAAQNGNARQPILVICQSGARAAKACQRLQEAGIGDVYCIEGGTTAWEKTGLPVERGSSKIISLERQVRIGAGSLVLLGALLAWTLHPAFVAICAFAGAGLVFAGVTDYCGMGIVLSKMPWNR